MINLVLALLAFVGTHFLMSHPLRAPMVAALGTRGQTIAYILVSLRDATCDHPYAGAGMVAGIWGWV